MRFAPLILLALCVPVLFLGLQSIGAIDQREARDLQVARELVAAREALTPVLGHEPLLEKPLVAYAPDALVRLVSKTPVADSRLWRALAATMLVVLTVSIGAQHFGWRAGWCAGGVLATSLAVPLAARTDGTQLLASLLGWIGAAGLADALFGRAAGRDARLVVTYGALAAALVTTGPLPALWPLGALALYLGLARLEGGWRLAQPLPGLVLMIGLAVPWYGAMAERHGGDFLAHAPFFPYALEPRAGWYLGPLLAVSYVVVGFFPWAALLPAALQHATTWWRRPRVDPTDTASTAAWISPIARELREESAAHYFIACGVAALVPIVFYPRPPFPAVLPALPAAALLCGRFLDHLFEDATRVTAALTRAAVMLALTGTVGSLMLAFLAGRVAGAAFDLRLLATAVFVTSWLPLLAQLLGRSRVAATLFALPVVLGAPIVALRVLPAMEGYLNARRVAETMNTISPELAPLVIVEEPAPSLRFYLHRNLARDGSLAAALAEFRAADGTAYVAFTPAREHDVAAAAGEGLEIVVRTPSLVLARSRR